MVGKQGKGRRLTDKERMEIIALTRQNPRIKHVELAAKYNVNESTIRKWRAQSNASKIEERYAHGVAASRDGRQRGQAVRNAQFDAELFEWVAGAMKQEQDLAPARVREKARALAAQYEGMEGFKASSGWFYRFCRRYGLPCGPAGRDTGSKTQNEMAVPAMVPMDLSPHGEDVALAQQSAVPAVPQPIGSAEPDQDVDMTASSSSAAAFSLSLQPSVEQAAEVVSPPTTEANETDQAAQPVEEGGVAPQATSGLLLGLGEMASGPAPPTVADAAVAEPVVPPARDASAIMNAHAVPTALPQVFSMAQAAATHMVHHFKDVLDPQTRLRLVRHFTRVAGEAEMYLVMDDETRLEYVKEFAAVPAATDAPGTTSTVV